MKNREDLTGQKFGRLTIISPAPNKGERTRWNCACECGVKLIVTTHDLKSGHTKSCGCLQRDMTSKIRKTHGKSNTRIYRVYLTMIQRCYCPTCNNYTNYGGRGITVCDEWKNDFQTFYKWAIDNGYDETAPRGVYTIERKDVNGNYEPTNCCLADMEAQANNTRNTIFFEAFGERLPLSQFARKYNIKRGILYYRVHNKGMTMEQALTQ